MSRNYCVYKHTFPNGKVYIGITGSNPLRRWGNGSNYTQVIMKKAIKKYGWDNIKHEVLFESLTKEEAKQKEIELIASHKSDNHEFGYNIKSGGDSSFNHTEETKRKMSATRKGRPKSEETKGKISLANKGRKRTEEQRKNISLAHMGIKQTEEAKRKIGEASKGRTPRLGLKNTKDHNEKISKSLKGRANTWYRRRVAQIDLMTNEVVKIYDYMKLAEIETGISARNITNACRGKVKTCGGYKWKYAEEI